MEKISKEEKSIVIGEWNSWIIGIAGAFWSLRKCCTDREGSLSRECGSTQRYTTS